MIEAHFKDLIEIPGVEALVLFDNHNHIIDSWTTSKYNPSIFNGLGETFLHVFGLLEYLNSEIDELAIPFERGMVVGRSFPKFYLIVISRLTVEIPLIRLAVNVCVREFLQHRKVKKRLKKMSDKKFYQIKSITLDDMEKIILENILENNNGAQ